MNPKSIDLFQPDVQQTTLVFNISTTNSKEINRSLSLEPKDNRDKETKQNKCKHTASIGFDMVSRRLANHLSTITARG